MAIAATVPGWAEVIDITQVRHFGPVPAPCTFDGGEMSASELLNCQINPRPEAFVSRAVASLNENDGANALNVVTFSLENRDYAEATLMLDGFDLREVSVDGKKISGDIISLTPATHKIQIKYVASADAGVPAIKVDAAQDGKIRQVNDEKRIFTLDDVLYGTRINRAAISCDGNYIIASYSDVDKSNKTTSYQRLFDLRTKKPVAYLKEWAQWMPDQAKYIVERHSHDLGRHIVATDPTTGAEDILASHLPDGQFDIAPGGKYIVFGLTKEGHKENENVYQVLEPEDRQPGWRDHSYPAIMALDGTNVLRPIASGKNNVYVNDISRDGGKLLLTTSHSRLEKRPTTVTSVLVYDVATEALDTLVSEDGFISSALFSPDASKVLLIGNPEALDGIGRTTEKTPSMTQNEMFVMDIASKKATPITRDFDPSVENAYWCQKDGNIYARVEERDIYAIYRYNPSSDRFTRLDLPENIVKGIDLASQAPLMGWWGQSDSNPDALYVTDLRNGKSTVLDQPSAERLKDVRIASCHDWNFTNRNGDTVYGRFYLPDDFDPNKKYPMIVNYYGGCSPTQRSFESRYPWHVYAQQGYVVYVLNPSGATGFGQEWASRHVNTAGDGVAQDILEGVDKFVAEHPYVDNDRVGCIGASYGGFMTQYLQTLTDRFACAISHAGISDHTSYWGEGYWGYSYSEVSMANSYPWSDPDLYVKHSPLYRADKVHTPLLFVHGDADTNVPVGESIQMFTALKLLGRPTALVQVKDQNHHILEYEKRKLWQNTIFAWFAKYLKDDSTWWDKMYPGQD